MDLEKLVIARLTPRYRMVFIAKMEIPPYLFKPNAGHDFREANADEWVLSGPVQV